MQDVYVKSIRTQKSDTIVQAYNTKINTAIFNSVKAVDAF